MHERWWTNAARASSILLLSVFAAAASRPDPATANPGRDYFTDTVLFDQYGQHYRFYSDLIAGRIVVITEVFTGCSASCPLIMARLAELQDLMGTQPITILSISVDPATDTPEVLRDYADKLPAGPGWHFLTGPEDAVRTIRWRLGDRGAAREDHSDVIVVGNDASGSWIKLTAIATTEDIAHAISVVAKRPN
jgi:protein SCO1/2